MQGILRLWQCRVVDAVSRGDRGAFGRAAADHAVDAELRDELEGALGAALDASKQYSLFASRITRRDR